MQTYTAYQDVDKEQLQIDIDNIKTTLGTPSQEDFQHLLKLERWGRGATIFGYLIIVAIAFLNMQYEVGLLVTSLLVILSAILISTGNVSRWANVSHPILHGAYDKVPNIPKRYTSKHYASGKRRYLDWLDWIKPEAWAYEHNIMHHYHLGEDDDPDNVENNLRWLTTSNVPMWLRYVIVYTFASLWKITYYAPNTLRILDNKERKKKKLPDNKDYEWNPFTKNGLLLWKDYILPYAVVRFIIIPLLFIPFGWSAVLIALITTVIAEIIANFHSFSVIVPNHSAGDIYRFETPHKTQGEFYLRQIMGSVNYNTGSDLIDFSHGWLNYQVEHHLFPNLPLSQYQKMQPIVKEICIKHNLEYRQESVFKRAYMTIELMVGKAELLRVEGV
ncbi:MAG: fatty acid desaturase [Sulfurovum sp.]